MLDPEFAVPLIAAPPEHVSDTAEYCSAALDVTTSDSAADAACFQNTAPVTIVVLLACPSLFQPGEDVDSVGLPSAETMTTKSSPATCVERVGVNEVELLVELTEV